MSDPVPRARAYQFEKCGQGLWTRIDLNTAFEPRTRVCVGHFCLKVSLWREPEARERAPHGGKGTRLNDESTAQIDPNRSLAVVVLQVSSHRYVPPLRCRRCEATTCP